MNNQWGIHLPNGELKDDKCFQLGVSNYVLLHLQPELARRAREASPDGIVLVRFYLPTWFDRDPVAWAEECAREYLQDRGGWSFASLRCDVTPANEMNLAFEAGLSFDKWLQMLQSGDLYRAKNEWLKKWVPHFVELTGCPKERLHCPADAYGHSDDQDDLGYVGLELCREAVEMFGVLDCHPYWFQAGQETSETYGHRFMKAHRLFPDMPLFISETGNFDVCRETTPAEMVNMFQSIERKVADEPKLKILGICPFMWEDPSKAHQVNDWSRNPKIAEAVKAAPKLSKEQGEGVNSVQNVYEFKLAFAEYARQHPEIGKATSDISYYQPNNIGGHQLITQWCEKGKLEYNEGAGKVAFFPFA